MQGQLQVSECNGRWFLWRDLGQPDPYRIDGRFQEIISEHDTPEEAAEAEAEQYQLDGETVAHLHGSGR